MEDDRIGMNVELRNVTITPEMYLIVLPLVFLAALVDSISGGGGLISLPAYTLAGLDYGFASGCNKFSACFGTVMATIRYFKSGKILLKPALMAALGALPGAWLGTQLSMRMSNRFMHIFMLFAIPVVGALVVLKKDRETAPRRVGRRTLLVCLGVLMAMSAKDTAGKILGAFLPVCYFVLCGFEHCVANMYYLSAGLMAKSVPAYAQLAAEAGVDLSALTLTNFLAGNLIPVTLGNILGGAALGWLMWFCHLKKH